MQIRICSFNIRNGGANKNIKKHERKKYTWENRKKIILEAIEDIKPDIIGLQECDISKHFEFLINGLKDFELINFKKSGEANPIFIKHSHFKMIEGAKLRLRPKQLPNNWNEACPRTANFVKVQIKSEPQTIIGIYNTHFDHKGKIARIESAKLIQREIQLSDEIPIILLGDFNTQDGASELKPLFSILKNTNCSNLVTFHGWRRLQIRFDYILTTDQFKVNDSGISNYKNDIYPSDHFPIWSDIEI
jgi:endonuclease/exonuclease/phosphatase family metal-dependent hydrolase